MPYSKVTDAPDWAQKMGEKAARQWIEVFNSTLKDTGSEEKASKAAASVVKKRDESKAASERRFTIAMPAPTVLAEKDKLARGEIIRAGSWIYGGEEMDITADMLAQAKRNHETHKRDVMLDYNHGSRIGKTPEEQKRAGDLVELELAEVDGVPALFGTFKPTEDAAGYLEKGEYKYLSAEFDEDYFHPEDKDWIGMYLQAVGLCNRPFIEGMAPITLMGEGAAKLWAQGASGYTGSLSIGYDCDEKHDVGDMLGEMMSFVKEKGLKVTSSSAGKYKNSPMMMQPKTVTPKTLTDTKAAPGAGFLLVERVESGDLMASAKG